MSPTPAQLRAARAWLGLSRAQAAVAAGLCVETLSKAERGAPTVGAGTLQTIAATYGARGVVFLGASGLERRSAA